MSRLRAWLSPKTGEPRLPSVLSPETGEPRLPSVLGPCVLRGQHLEGWLPWPADPFYRPLVGVFLDRQLRRILTTRRRPAADAEGPHWRCAFSANIGILAAHDPRRLAVICLETGAQVGALGSPVSSEVDAWGVPELIAFAERQQPHWDCTGFASFLDLSVPDQIGLLYRDILGRGVDPYGAGSFLHDIASGQLTILDVRDRLAFSDEFQQHRQASVVRQLGQWSVWGGIKDIVPIIVPSPLPAAAPARSAERAWADADTDLVSSIELVARRQKLGDYLARLALGNERSPKLVRQWQSDHSAQISELTALAEGRQAARRSRAQAQAEAQAYPMNFGELFSAMHIGAAGYRVEDRIRSHAGVAG